MVSASIDVNTMKLQLTILVSASLFTVATAQIDDSRAITIAGRFLERFAPESRNIAPSVSREMVDSPGGPTPVIEVSFGEVFVRLNQSGELRSYTNLSPERPIDRAEPDRYSTDEQAWQAIEAIITELPVPTGLTRKSFERNAPGGPPHIMRFFMHPRPYGYKTNGGNTLSADMHQKTGRVNAIRVSRGWTYEPPNLRITTEQAIELARLAHGGTGQDWQADIRYASFGRATVPQYLRTLHTSKTMRLFYFVWGPRGEVRVDSVTGEIIEFISPDQVGSSHGERPGLGSGGSAASQESTSFQSNLRQSDLGQQSSPTAAPGASNSPITRICLVASIALAVAGGIAAFAFRCRRTL